MPKGVYKRKPEHIKRLIQMNKSRDHIEKVRKANTGKKFTEERKKNLRLNHADFSGDRNPNWQGNNVGVIGIHIWLNKFFKKKCICEFCGLKGNTYTITWAKRKGCKYLRKRNNFIELCRKCHVRYDGLGFKKGNKVACK